MAGCDAVVPIPVDCADGFNEAYYGRPEALLDPGRRRSCSAWSFVPGEVHERFERALERDLADGTWDRRHGHLRPAADVRAGRSSWWWRRPPDWATRRRAGAASADLATGSGAASSSAACSGFTMLIRTPVPSSNPATVVSFGTTWTCQWYGSGARYGAEWKTRL